MTGIISPLDVVFFAMHMHQNEPAPCTGVASTEAPLCKQGYINTYLILQARGCPSSYFFSTVKFS